MRRALQYLATSAAVLCCIIIILYGDRNFAKFPDFRPAAVSKLTLETRELKFQDIGLLKGLGVEFLPNFKNPCWYEVTEAHNDLGKNKSFYASLSKSPSLSKYRYKRETKKILRCLPYFFLTGQPKCATTDIFQRINIHPDVVEPIIKGPHWWTRRRFGPPYAPQPVTLSEYLGVFNASRIEEERTDLRDASQGWFHEKITGDGSTSTLWDSSLTMSYLHKIMAGSMHKPITKYLLSRRHGSNSLSNTQTYSLKIKEAEDGVYVNDEENLQEFKYHQYHNEDGIVLPFTVADVIHSVLPKSRIIAVIREPLSRLYSSYLFFTKKTSLSPEDFDENVKTSIQKWKNCIREYSDRTCAYNKTLQNSMGVRLYNGLYSIFIRDWLKVFQRKHVLILRMEDYHQNITETMDTIFSHLDLRKLTQEEGRKVNMAPVRNKNRKKPEIGKMPESTADILQAFYKPYNRDLANLLQDSRFTWEDIYSKGHPEQLHD
ncbi:carbohydrate sulfotransferase 15-like [Panulirus ornatus]|uniref:carbohydrate sulfotransferase 15-like n=1 Tax=Panulirus ornatus TaxID=150431 RepID=UPI003A86879D